MQMLNPLSTKNIAVLKMVGEPYKECYVTRRVSDNLTGLIIHDQDNKIYRLTVPYIDCNGNGQFLNLLMNSLSAAITEMELISFS